MNKLFFRLLVLLMSLSLIGIILVQVYWFNTSFKNNDELRHIALEHDIIEIQERDSMESYISYINTYN